MYISQAKANAELIAEPENGMKIEDEKEEVDKQKKEFGDGAEAEYIRLGAELREDLKVPPVSPNSAHKGLGNRSVEGDAIDVSVTDQAGTNLNTEAPQVTDQEQNE